MTFTQVEVDRMKHMGCMIAGVAYHEELAGPDGMRFTLIDEGQTSLNFEQAKIALLQSRDVVGAIQIAKIKEMI